MIHPFPNTTWQNWKGLYPELRGNGHFIAEGVRLIGDIQLEAQSSIWFNSVLRADNAPIRIGEGTNIQDNSTLHTDPDFPVILGQYVTVGHHCLLHGCTISDHTLVGMGSILMNGAKIGANCLIGAGSLILENFEAPDGVLIVGSPARIKRELSQEEQSHLKQSALGYIQKAAEYAKQGTLS